MFPKKLTKQVVCLPDYPVVSTRQGKLRGLEVEGAFIFRGIRYAQARRFQMPEFPEPWEGIKDAVQHGPVCAEISTLVPPDAYVDPHSYFPQSEHCQYLNIWTPTIDPAAKKPVMVWLHGGGYQHGSPLEIFTYDGEELSAYGDVVVVSLAHRLNVLGFLDLSDYGEEYRYSGTVGMADIVKALEWIKENITGFGGDPDNVTVFGQSGGGAKVCDLLQIPAADGLFHKACMHSGGAGSRGHLTHKDAADFTEILLETLELSKDTVHELGNVPYYLLAKAVNEAEKVYRERHPQGAWSGKWGPVADGEYYLGHPVNVGFREESKHIPILVGNCLGEFNFMDFDPNRIEDGPVTEWTPEVLERRARKAYGEHAEEVLAAFAEAYPDKPLGVALFTDSYMRPEHIEFARLRAAQPGSAPVYNWLLTVDMPASIGSTTAWHNAEEPFVLHNAAYLEAVYVPGVMDRLADQMAGAWAAFAYTGDPNHPGMPHWDPVRPGTSPAMLFDANSHQEDGHDHKLMEVYGRLVHWHLGAQGPVRKYGGGPRNSI